MPSKIKKNTRAKQASKKPSRPAGGKKTRPALKPAATRHEEGKAKSHSLPVQTDTKVKKSNKTGGLTQPEARVTRPKQAQSRSVADLLNKKWDHPIYKGFGRPVPPVRAVYTLPYYALRSSGTWLMVCNPQASPTQGTVILFDERGHPLHRRDFSIVANGAWNLTMLDHVEEGIGYSLLMTTSPVIVYQQVYRVLGGQVLASCQSREDNMLAWSPQKNPRTYGFAFRSSGDSYDAPVVALLLANPTSSRWSGYLQLSAEDGKAGSSKRIVIEPGNTREVRFPAGRMGLGRLQTSDPCGLMLVQFAGNPLEVASTDLLGRSNRLDPAPSIRQRQGRIYIDTGHVQSWYRLEEGYWQPLLGLLRGLDLTTTMGNTYPLTPQVLENQDVLVLSAPERTFTPAEERVLRDFVAQGGSLLVEGEWGPTPDWTPVTQQVLGLFGASSDENLARDEKHNVYDSPTRIRFEKVRNFLPHPITEDLDLMVTNAGATLTGDDTWSTVIRTSRNATPSERPVMMARSYGFGRILAVGDTNAWIPGEAERPMDFALTRSVFEWLLFNR